MFTHLCLYKSTFSRTSYLNSGMCLGLQNRMVSWFDLIHCSFAKSEPKYLRLAILEQVHPVHRRQ